MSVYQDPLLNTLLIEEGVDTNENQRGKDLSVNRYYRITPQFIRALCAYMSVTVNDFMKDIGMAPHDFSNFYRTYHPNRNFGSQVAFQCGIYWVLKTLYREGVVPYSLAQLGGLFDKEAFFAEKKLLQQNIINARG